jgi:hypothetical protein
MEKIIIRNLVSSQNSEELYHTDAIREFGIDEDEVYDWEIKEERPDKMLDDNYSDEVSTISIKDMEKILKNAKKKGATHVGIFYHCDHTEYEVYGYNFQMADEAYLLKKEQEEQENINKKKQENINKLLADANRLGLSITIN